MVVAKLISLRVCIFSLLFIGRTRATYNGTMLTSGEGNLDPETKTFSSYCYIFEEETHIRNYLTLYGTESINTLIMIPALVIPCFPRYQIIE